MGSFQELAQRRRSVRAYRAEPVPEELIEAVLEAARWAPSAVNSQPWEFIVVTDPELKAAVGRQARYFGVGWPHIHQAPVLIAVCGRRLTPFARDDCLFAAANLMLAAADLGLGTCWIGGFAEGTIKELLGIPEAYVLPGFCTLGYPAGETPPPPKRALEEMVHRDGFQGRRGSLRRWWGPLEVIGRLLRLQIQGPRAGR
jgi:nitroreductase